MKLKNNKLKYMLLATGILGVSAILPVTLLTSCSSTSNPFGPYTAISLNNENTLRYNTKSGNIEFYNNKDILNGEYKNEWVDISELKTYYLKLANQSVQDTLNDSNKLNDLIAKYNQVGNANPNSVNAENIKNTYKSANFMYGVEASEQQKRVADILNYMSILGSAFIAVDTLAQNMINYVINSEFTQTYNNLLDKNLNSVFDLSKEIKGNDEAAQFFMGSGVSFGSGSSTYHLWPSGFDFELSSSKLATSDINSPYPYFQDGKDGTAFASQQTISFTNIKINYQWYKTSKNGGDYVVAENVQNNLTNEQKSMLENLGIKTLSNGYSLTINESIDFNVVPDSSSYLDPLFSNIVDHVYTGLYNIVPQVQKSDVNSEIKENVTYPEYLKTNNIAWRTVQSESKNNKYSASTLGETLYKELNTILGNQFNGNGIKTIPYYAGNNQWTSMGEDFAAYCLPNSNLGYKDMKYVSKVFIDPYYNEQGDRYVANNNNDLPKVNYMDLWVLGALSMDLEEKVITDGYNELKNIDLNQYQSYNTSESLKPYMDLFNSGLTTYYSIINFGSISAGYNIVDNNNGTFTKN